MKTIYYLIPGLVLLILSFAKIDTWYPWHIFIGLIGYALIVISFAKLIWRNV